MRFWTSEILLQKRKLHNDLIIYLLKQEIFVPDKNSVLKITRKYLGWCLLQRITMVSWLLNLHKNQYNYNYKDSNHALETVSISKFLFLFFQKHLVLFLETTHDERKKCISSEKLHFRLQLIEFYFPQIRKLIKYLAIYTA